MLATPVIAVASIILSRPPITRLPTGILAALVLLTAATIAGIAVAGLAAHALYRRTDPLWKRIHLTLVGFVGLAMLPFLAYWNLLGIQT